MKYKIFFQSEISGSDKLNSVLRWRGIFLSFGGLYCMSYNASNIVPISKYRLHLNL
jgi:hypothetical protein